MKKHVSFRLSKEDVAKLKRHNQPMTKQLRDDLALVTTIERMIEEGMSDHPLGRIMEIIRGM